MNTVCIDENYCKGCNLCIDQCPKNVLKVSNRRNARGYLLPEACAAQDCIGCRLCEMICPDMAVTVETKEDEK